jgi:hypothetical protein
VIIFTTTRKPDAGLFGDDNGPLMSRCYRITLTNQGVSKAFAEYARDIADRENLNGQPMARYLRLAQDCNNNLRLMLTRIESGDMLD